MVRFVRVTLLAAVCLMILFLLVFVVKLLLAAALLAAVALAGVFLYTFARNLARGLWRRARNGALRP
jgi:hypothetical protein